MKKIKLERTENDRKISAEKDSGFIYEYQKAVLLALVDLDFINETQYEYAEGILRKQRNKIL